VDYESSLEIFNGKNTNFLDFKLSEQIYQDLGQQKFLYSRTRTKIFSIFERINTRHTKQAKK
jgi:hypothetical protein